MRDPESLRAYLTRDQYRLYKLIWERFIASQMASAVLDTMSVDIAAGETMFRAVGSKIRFPGFMKVYVEGSDDDGNSKEKKIFAAAETRGSELQKIKIEPKQHFTQPPPRYTEARSGEDIGGAGDRPSEYVRANTGNHPEARIRSD